MVLCLREPLVRFLWCCLLFLIHCCFCDIACCCFYASGLLFHATDSPLWFLRPVKASTSSELYPGYFRMLYFSVTFLPRALWFWVVIFYPQAFFTLRSFPIFLPQPAFIKAAVEASSSSLAFAGLHALPRNRSEPSVRLFHSKYRQKVKTDHAYQPQLFHWSDEKGNLCFSRHWEFFQHDFHHNNLTKNT